MQTAAFLDYLEREKQDILEHCTQCGKCVEVCPMPQYAPVIAQADPQLVVGQVLELLRTGKGVLELTSTSRPGSPATVSATVHFQKGLKLRQLAWSRVPRFARVHRAHERVALTSQGEKDRRVGESGKSVPR